MKIMKLLFLYYFDVIGIETHKIISKADTIKSKRARCWHFNECIVKVWLDLIKNNRIHVPNFSYVNSLYTDL